MTTKFVVTTKRGDVEEPVVFEIEIREEIAASVSGQRLEEDTKAVMDILAGADVAPLPWASRCGALTGFPAHSGVPQKLYIS